MFRCASKFDIEENEAMYLKEFISKNKLVIEQISDTKEQDGQERADDDQMGEVEKGEEVIRSNHEAKATEPPLPISEDNTRIRTSNQARFPPIAALARDALSFPATGVGVERLFNTARDVCHYRRGRMKSDTIEDLMMFLCTPRFDIEEQEAKLLEKFFSHDEILDAEEQDNTIDEEIELDEALSATFEEPTGRESQVPLPGNNPQVRASGRKRKSREDDIFEYH
ncbi:hypothetical protein N7474_010275 [Penicillium riverlandense]|uniref:uncharacterized protein n=1 Tax=Penicillium riverlandense TaxID=1903569 RepID=UPI002549979F|nr:uncharacterized protein N7474_010275 [Penicillium riverlandense]KAJ5806683.1 hypothetical protein N7474_010275 [Penicillium riverlandense]